MAKREDTEPGLRAKYTELSRKYSALVGRVPARPPALVVGATTGARLASIGLALFDRKGAIVHRTARWSVLAPAGLVPKLAAAVREPRETGPSIQQFRVRGRGGAALVVRLEALDGMTVAFVGEESTAWPADEERARSRLWQGERLRVLGQLAAAVAHDLSSTLRSVRYLLSSVEADEVVRRRCAKIIAAMARGLDDSSQVVAHLHDFARTGAQASQLVNLSAIIREAVKLYELDAPANGGNLPKVVIRCREIAAVRAAPGELTHVFLNLLRNARDATIGKGEITIGCVKAAGTIRVAVADRGTGIAQRDLPRLFEPFFTTKGDRGTGLGLFICAGLVERMGGSIRAANRRDGGAVFTVELPTFNGPSAGPLAGLDGSNPPASRRSPPGSSASRRSSPA